MLVRVVAGMRITTQFRPEGFRWTLVDGLRDERLLARSGSACADLATCLAGVQQFFDAAPQVARPARQPGGGWRWTVLAGDGTVVAESADVFDHPAACGYALYELRHALARNGFNGRRGSAPAARA